MMMGQPSGGISPLVSVSFEESAPSMLQAPLDDSRHVLLLRDTGSIQALSQRLQTAKRVMIVGNGGIALELVQALRGYEVQIKA